MTDTGEAIADIMATDLSSNELERRYADQRDLAYRRKHGQFFTPFSVARFMVQWAIRDLSGHPRILDPCAGLGVFERAIVDVNPDFAGAVRFELWEKDDELAHELGRVCESLAIRHSVSCKDFLDGHAWSPAYDAIVANPPYYKHHFVENKEEVRDLMSSKLGIAFSVQTNIYCWFLIKSLALLKPGGRLAFIIPTEFLNANYGRNVKQHLLDTGFLRHIISICYRSRAFDDAITTACVILAERGSEPGASLRCYRAESIDELADLDSFLNEAEFREYRCSDLDAGRKWRSLFPGGQGIDIEDSRLVPFSNYGRFSRGIATGANSFFAIRPSTAGEMGLPASCLIPCVSKARQAPGKRFTQQDFEILRQEDRPVFLFDGEAASGKSIQRYIISGRSSGYHNRFLTKARSPWYALEKRRPGRIWVSVFGRSGIRFVWNESNCVTLTCFHVFQPSDIGRSYIGFLYLYLNSDFGRNLLELEKREYGDGLEKYEPNDINESPAPDFSLLAGRDIDRLCLLQEEYLQSGMDTESEQAILAEADTIFDGFKSRA